MRAPVIDLDGAVVAITGAARGIGRATAAAMTQRGARALLGDLDLEVVEDVAAELGPRARAQRLDVTSRDSFAEFIAAAERRGPLDVLVNNAGVMPISRFLEESDATSRTTLDVNVWGPIQGMKLALPGMIERGCGHVVNVVSGAGKMHEPGLAVYCASKYAMVGLSASVREELGGTGVTISAVLPTAVRTELSSGVPLRGLFPVEPTEVARAIAGSVESRAEEIWVPRWLAAYEPFAALLPAPLMRLTRKMLAADRTLNDVDDAARAAYENRLARQRGAA